jgi:vacuolar-type H+-ATPase subunit C/Vma6
MKRQEAIASSDFVNAKVRGMRSSLLENDRLQALTESRTLAELARRLHPESTEAPTHLGLQRRFNDETAAELNRLARFLAAEVLTAYECVLQRYPLDVVKVILRAHLTHTDRAAVEPLISAMPYGLALPLDRLFEAADLRRFAEELPFRPMRIALRSVLKANERPDAFILEAALDSAYFRSLGDSARKVENPARKLLSFDVDSRNLLLALRAKFTYHWEYANAADFLVPSGVYLSNDLLRAVFGAVDVTDAINRLPLTFIPKEARLTATTAAQLEDLLLRLLYARARAAFAGLVLDEGIAIAYAYVKQIEMLNLARLTEGVRHGLPRDEIAAHLMLLER